ncbi:MAG: hypothetical protein IJY14_03420 [Acholeplasmatales bacterium]|nr:hypothetical protein [Acholeplasmatales bacterium]
MKKQLLIAGAIFAGLFSLASCGGNEDKTEPSNTNPSESIQPSVDEYDGFSATVLYPDGSPVKEVMVQWCIGEVCFNAIATDENGVAKNPDLNKGKDYIVHVTEASMPAGYSYNPNLYKSDDNNMQITINLVKLNEVTGDGSIASPYTFNEGMQFLYIENTGKSGVQYFTFTAAEAATYEIESVYDVNSAFPQLPALHEFNSDGSYIKQRAVNGTGEEDNFKYSFEATAGTTYIYGVMLVDGSDGMADLPITITKK